MSTSGIHIHITGIVQGVGFRPFVYGLAQRLELTGWVNNTSAGVDIEANGSPEALSAFAACIQEEAPPLAKIDSLIVSECEPNGYNEFTIEQSTPIEGAYQPISPDVSICPDCFNELFDPQDRRYRYPFINCTNCGPRFTIIEDIPYDRPLTTMAEFEMCSDCYKEYTNPLDRRFHAQPVACPECGPHIWLEMNQGKTSDAFRYRQEKALQMSRDLLRQGQIVAIKGLGGFHLCCDATNRRAVAELRKRKLRVDKPFGLMMIDSDVVRKHCFINEAELRALESKARPIVILRRKPNSSVVEQIAPGQDTLGVMLPYTPLHYLLLEREPDFPTALVLTSGNLSEEPIAIKNQDARIRLDDLADGYLFHNRDIHTRNDDSVIRILPENVRTEESRELSIRRSRGYAPYPIKLPWEVPPMLATGAELKNTFCLANDRYAFLSQHIGDMENYETMQAFEEGVTHLSRLFRVQPELISYDLHPNYLASRIALQWAKEQGLPSIGVQHHHAHIAACMAEHGLSENTVVIGVSFDGTGYGDDGAIWGGEILLADYIGYERPYHLSYMPMPGGDAAVREPWRLALTWMKHAGLSWEESIPPVYWAKERTGIVGDRLTILERQLQSNLNTPLTSSMGRLFDAVSALIGVRQTVNFEAQAAIELESIADSNEHGLYDMNLREGIIEAEPMIRALVSEFKAGISKSTISARFHNGVAKMVADVCQEIRSDKGVNTVVLSGGVWQNMMLLERTLNHLRENEFEIKFHRQVPTNDGGLSLGQVAIAAQTFATNSSEISRISI